MFYYKQRVVLEKDKCYYKPLKIKDDSNTFKQASSKRN